MLFSTWTFAIFLLVVFAIYHAVPTRVPKRGMVQMVWLTVASMVFYGFHIPWLVLLLIGSLVVNGLVSRRLLLPGLAGSHRLFLLALGLSINLGALAFFKYANLLAETFLSSFMSDGLSHMLHQIPLPVGISFYTFQGLSLVVDAYQGRREGMESLIAEKDAPRRFHAKVWFYIAFFPQLVAGPIIKAHDFVNQISSKTLADVDWRDATRKLILGFFLKMVIADNLKDLTLNIELAQARSLSGLTHWILLYAFSFQIFADFAGYSLIAMGLGRLFGYQFPVNFNYPYISASITEFWRRWHISLSTWLRDYLYFPLGGNRKGAVRTYINLFIVMSLGGLWHGAAWSYAIWGMAHGIFLAMEKASGLRPATYATPINEGGGRTHMLALSWGLFSKAVRIFIVFNIVSLLWLLFKLPHFPDVLDYLQAMGKGGLRASPQFAFVFMFFSVPVVIYHIWGLLLGVRMRLPVTSARYEVLESAVLGLLLFFIVTNSGSSGAFIYFQF